MPAPGRRHSHRVVMLGGLRCHNANVGTPGSRARTRSRQPTRRLLVEVIARSAKSQQAQRQRRQFGDGWTFESIDPMSCPGRSSVDNDLFCHGAALFCVSESIHCLGVSPQANAISCIERPTRLPLVNFHGCLDPGSFPVGFTKAPDCAPAWTLSRRSRPGATGAAG